MPEIKTAKGRSRTRFLEEALSLVDEARYELKRAGSRYDAFDADLLRLHAEMEIRMENESDA